MTWSALGVVSWVMGKSGARCRTKAGRTDMNTCGPARQTELLPVWWTPSLGCFLKLEGADGAATVQPGVQAGGSPAG